MITTNKYKRNYTVNVERCWGGNSSYYFRLSWVDGSTHREYINGEVWDRSLARDAGRKIRSAYGYGNDVRIRFSVQ